MTKVLIVHPTEPAAYPPIVNSALMMAERGWEVHVLGAPVEGRPFKFPAHSRISRHDIRMRPSHILTPRDYITFTIRAVALAVKLRPDLLYISDPIGTLPGLLASFIGSPAIVYHEHDSPNSHDDLSIPLKLGRRTIARRADIAIFPNAARAEAAIEEVGFPRNIVEISWNTPRRAEVVAKGRVNGDDGERFVFYYHGTIVPDRLPEAVICAISKMSRKAIVRIVGYETASGFGYTESLVSKYGSADRGGTIDYLGPKSRSEILRLASMANIGLALVPTASKDINMRNMTGASNKVFDYMAAGLPVIVSDLPDWVKMFVEPGFGFALQRNSIDEMKERLEEIVADEATLLEISKRNRAKIEAEWHYESTFSNILDKLQPS